MIPKIIHYCWYGNGEYSEIQKMCFASWKKYLPDYQFMLWNESNSDMQQPFVKLAYENKKYAFVSDYVRLKAVYDHGGIYLDTDMFVLKSFDDLLNHSFFIGAENKDLISAGIFGSEKGHDYIKECFKYYEDPNPQEWQLKLAIPRILTRGFESYINKQFNVFDKIVTEKELVVYTPEFFYPLPFDVNKPFQKDFLKYATPRSIAIHLWEGSWIDYDFFQLIRRGDYSVAMHKIDFKKKLTYKFLIKSIKALIYSFKN
ncbi:glycosyltransferase family 32 protein [Flavobacterium sp. S87F.05.LMB.W.Kidney.N]|uniref:glycosyltransferase family 32 protein n=1 Tax=Flavobacterium sp. S87F.05.LMB.W.Kidney.N TaxID=1278758 RepID=UPI001066C631|nr:glycosyltransferase [Flavobacterium sp. S87F.05.LMB.W.Kidney.N]TDX09301.1 glycosyl transferase-like sugar-binding protein [Flavobacterium sp. S87F.05.LMB.W.Kidney.N]